jgi:hypothetical protein
MCGDALKIGATLLGFEPAGEDHDGVELLVR